MSEYDFRIVYDYIIDKYQAETDLQDYTIDDFMSGNVDVGLFLEIPLFPDECIEFDRLYYPMDTVEHVAARNHDHEIIDSLCRIFGQDYIMKRVNNVGVTVRDIYIMTGNMLDEGDDEIIYNAFRTIDNMASVLYMIQHAKENAWRVFSTERFINQIMINIRYDQSNQMIGIFYAMLDSVYRIYWLVDNQQDNKGILLICLQSIVNSWQGIDDWRPAWAEHFIIHILNHFYPEELTSVYQRGPRNENTAIKMIAQACTSINYRIPVSCLQYAIRKLPVTVWIDCKDILFRKRDRYYLLDILWIEALFDRISSEDATTKILVCTRLDLFTFIFTTSQSIVSALDGAQSKQTLIRNGVLKEFIRRNPELVPLYKDMLYENVFPLDIVLVLQTTINQYDKNIQ